jgi:lysophospholipase
MSNSIFEQFSFEGPRPFKLFGRLWHTTQRARGSVIACHGYTEHSGRYEDLAADLTTHGYHFGIFDLPGHGLSSGRRANIDNFDDYVASLELFCEQARDRTWPEPYFLLGHSLGGLISIRFLQSSKAATKIKAALVTCPLLGLSTHSFHGVGHLAEYAWGARLLRWMCEIAPNISLPNKKDLGGSVLTHDPHEVELRKQDPLIKPTVTIHWTREFLKAIDLAVAQKNQLQTPLCILQAEDDRVVSVKAPKQFFDLLTVSPKKYMSYPNMWHELLKEINRDQVRSDIREWFHQFVEAKGST